MKNKQGLIAKRVMNYIRKNSNNEEEYFENLTHTKNVIGEEIDKKKAENMNSELRSYALEKNAVAIYEIAKSGNKSYNTQDIVDAIVMTDNADYIACVAGLCTKINITKTQFLKCCKAIAESKDIDTIIAFANHCTGTYTTRNTFNVLKQYVEYISETEDLEVMKNIIATIDKRRTEQRARGGSWATPLGACISTEQVKFRAELVGALYRKENELQ